jgi:hypothetical protein
MQSRGDYNLHRPLSLEGVIITKKRADNRKRSKRILQKEKRLEEKSIVMWDWNNIKMSILMIT